MSNDNTVESVGGGINAPGAERDAHVWVPEGGESRMRTGRVVSNKMQNTVVIGVERLVRHRIYKKIMRRTSKFMAHDELNCNPGDLVRIIETRPISKMKRWRVVEILERAPQITSLKEIKES